MRKIVALMMSLLLALACVAGVVTVSAEADLPTALFEYDFTVEGAADALGFNELMDCKVTYDGVGHITFTAEEGELEVGESEGANPDCYFKFGDDHQPGLFCQAAKYMIIKYRTTAETKGQFYTNRSDYTMWGQDGNVVEWVWEADGEWNLALVDASEAWAASAGEGVTFQAFRFDPMDGGVEGDTIDIAFIKFFDAKEDAEEFRRLSDPVKYTFYTATFLREDGTVLREILFREGDTELENVPAVPRKKPAGKYVGAWSEYTLGAENITITPVYTIDPDWEEETEPAPVETTTAAVEEITTAAEDVTTAVEDVTTVVEDVTTVAAEEITTAAAVEDATTSAVEAATTASAGTDNAGCKSVIASASVLAVVAVAAGVVVRRKKD